MNGDKFDEIVAKLSTLKLTELPDEFKTSQEDTKALANQIP